MVPFFATSHIAPFTVHRPRRAPRRGQARRHRANHRRHPGERPGGPLRPRAAGPAESGQVKIVTYPFPAVDGLAAGVETLSAAGADAWRIDAAAVNEARTRPAQEALLRERRPDAVVTDFHFFLNSAVAEELSAPCVTFSVIGPFASLAMSLLAAPTEPGTRWLCLDSRIPRYGSELPEFLRRPGKLDNSFNPQRAALARCFSVAVNTFVDLEQQYCEMFVRAESAKRGYFLGPVSLPLPPSRDGEAGTTSESSQPCLEWLGSKPSCSVVYVCFSTYAAISEEQLGELALGLETSGKPFLWAARADDGWAPPDGWAERVGDRGVLARGWVPQTAVLAHPSVGPFLTHCGSSSILKAAAAGVPMLTWPLVFDQFIEGRLVTDVLKIGERVWDGPRSTRYEEREVVPAAAVARAVATFLEPGREGQGAGARREGARGRGRVRVVVP